MKTGGSRWVVGGEGGRAKFLHAGIDGLHGLLFIAGPF